MPKLTERAAKPKPSSPSVGEHRVWTTHSKIMGNLIPALIALPFAIYGLLLMSDTGVIMGRGLWFFAASPIVLWLAMNFLGLYRNSAMKRLLAARLKSSHPELASMLAISETRRQGPAETIRNFGQVQNSGPIQNPKSKIQNSPQIQNRKSKIENSQCLFVGIATPKYTSLLDPHEDVGFLIVRDDRLEFLGDHLNLSVAKNDVSAIQFRINPHTLVGLGRWVSVEGRSGNQRIRLQIEPRERKTLLGNMLLSGWLKRRLKHWMRT